MRFHMACHVYFRILLLMFPLALLFFSTPVFADWTPLIERLVTDKFDEQTIKNLFAQPGVKFDPDIMSSKLRELIHNRSKRPDALYAHKIRTAYARFLTQEAIAEAHSYAQRNSASLEKIEKDYCVSKEIVVAIMLVETDLGQNLGTRGAFNTLASMALSSDLEIILPHLAPNLVSEKNEAFARKRCRQKADWAYTELKALITYASEVGINPLSIPGSLYGAIGLCQFMPSQISTYGVDADEDGRINLFSKRDALYSVANYLRAHGWKCGMSSKRKSRVIRAYNNSKIYANTILGVAERLKRKG